MTNMFAVSKMRKLRSEELISSPHVFLSWRKVVDRLAEDFVVIFFLYIFLLPDLHPLHLQASCISFFVYLSILPFFPFMTIRALP